MDHPTLIRRHAAYPTTPNPAHKTPCAVASVDPARPEGTCLTICPTVSALPSTTEKVPDMPQSSGRASIVSPFYMSAWARVSLGSLLLLGLWLAILWAVQP